LQRILGTVVATTLEPERKIALSDGPIVRDRLKAKELVSANFRELLF
jgi:hypothetical protein